MRNLAFEVQGIEMVEKRENLQNLHYHIPHSPDLFQGKHVPGVSDKLLFSKEIKKGNLKLKGFPGGSEGKASACNAGDLSSIPRSGKSPGEGNGNQLQYSCLENSTDGGAWSATVHGVTESYTT